MTDFFSLKNKHILITGASSGIGKACAIACSKMGAKLSLFGRDRNKLNALLEMLDGDNHQTYSVDLGTLDGLDSAIEDAVQKNGQLSGFVHSAGIEFTLPLKQHKPQKIVDIFQVNVFSALEITRQVCSKKNFVASGGSIIWISSIMGVVSNPALLGYSATKGALISGAKSLSLELASRRIRVNTVSPGHLSDTEMSIKKESSIGESALQALKDSHPLGLGSTEDVSNSVIFLLGNCSKWITGTNIIVDGGYSAK